MNRMSFYFFAFLTIAVILSACSTPKKTSYGKLQIVATIYPYQLITQQIAGNLADVTTFIPGSASPHTYSPTPRDVQKLHDADLIIANGLNLETNMISYLKEIGNKVLFSADFIPPNMLTQDMEEHTSFNPHLWTDPDMIVLIAKGIELRLEELDPSHKEIFNQNLAQLELDITKANKQIQMERSKYRTLGIVTFHDSFKYFNDRYAIKLIGTVESSPGKEPSPKELLALGAKIKQYNVHAIFIEPEFNPKPAEVIGKEYKLSVIKYDPIGTTLNVNTISAFLLKNWELLKQGF